MIETRPILLKQTKLFKARPDISDVDAGKYRLAFSERTYVMGILNVTPDSFSDGGRFFGEKEALSRAIEMAGEGADIIDIGGESTRPGSRDVTLDEELDRVIPVIRAIAERVDIPISIDTRKAEVARSAIEAGACIVNDVSALRHDPEMAKAVASSGVALIVMHMKGSPEDMQENPSYCDVIAEISTSLAESIEIAKRYGISERRIMVDPGIGFGKTVRHNLIILNRLDELACLGRPICVGTSRKSFIARALNLADSDSRLAGTLASCAVAIMKGARLLRVHDVRQAKELARMTDSVIRERTS